MRFYHFQFINDCLSIHRHNASPRFYNRCLSQPSLSTSRLLFYKNTCKFRNTIVYRDIKIYRSNVKTLCFLEKLSSASATHFALQLGNQATDHFFFSATQVHIGIPISGLISIFIKCAVCQVVAQWVTYLTSGGYPNTWQEAVDFRSVSINFQHYLCG